MYLCATLPLAPIHGILLTHHVEGLPRRVLAQMSPHDHWWMPFERPPAYSVPNRSIADPKRIGGTGLATRDVPVRLDVPVLSAYSPHAR